VPERPNKPQESRANYGIVNLALTSKKSY